MSSTHEAWAVIWPNGRIVAESTFTDADHALRTVLGWPTRGEVKDFLTTGGRVVRVKIEVMEGGR